MQAKMDERLRRKDWGEIVSWLRASGLPATGGRRGVISLVGHELWWDSPERCWHFDESYSQIGRHKVETWQDLRDLGPILYNLVSLHIKGTLLGLILRQHDLECAVAGLRGHLSEWMRLVSECAPDRTLPKDLSPEPWECAGWIDEIEAGLKDLREMLQAEAGEEE